MNIDYFSCFSAGDAAEAPLVALLGTLGNANVVTSVSATNGEDLRQKLEKYLSEGPVPDVLIIGGHGHTSLSGFWVQDDPVRWHDLAFLLRGRLSESTTFVFYSCDGGYPGIAHVFGRDGGPDFVFGPRISVYATAMTHAVEQIVAWKTVRQHSPADACQLIDVIHKWAAATFPDEPDHHQFLRVIWGEGSKQRYPAKPGPEKPEGSAIPLRSWNL